MCEALGLPEKETAEDMSKTVADEIMLGGSENFFTSLKSETLRKFAADLGVALSSDMEHDKLVDNLMVKIFELEPYDAFQKLLVGESDDAAEVKRADTGSKKRKREDESTEQKAKKKGKYVCPPLDNIKEGITADELRDLYNVTDLQDWCKQHDVTHVGKKSVVIKNILYFLDTGEKPKTPKSSPKAQAAKPQEVEKPKTPKTPKTAQLNGGESKKITAPTTPQPKTPPAKKNQQKKEGEPKEGEKKEEAPQLKPEESKKAETPKKQTEKPKKKESPKAKAGGATEESKKSESPKNQAKTGEQAKKAESPKKASQNWNT